MHKAQLQMDQGSQPKSRYPESDRSLSKEYAGTYRHKKELSELDFLVQSLNSAIKN